MNTKEEVKRKRAKLAIDYRRYQINYILIQIQDLSKRLKEINDMPENLIEKISEERMEWLKIEEQNRELSNKKLGELKI